MIANVKIKKDQAFKEYSGKSLLADVFLPDQETSDPSPALLLIHGGAWQAGSKEMYRDWGPYLAENGFAGISIDYRLSSKSESTWPEVLADVRDAYDWLVQNSEEFNINPERIGVIGDSCGAQLALLLALEKSHVKTVVSVYGVYDVEAWWHYTQLTRDDDPVGNLFGSPPSQAAADYKLASPAAQISQFKALNDLNCLMIWGEQDTIVPAKQSREFFKQLDEANLHAEKIVIPDKGHFWFTIFPGISGGRITDEPNNTIAPKVIGFLKRTL